MPQWVGPGILPTRLSPSSSGSLSVRQAAWPRLSGGCSWPCAPVCSWARLAWLQVPSLPGVLTGSEPHWRGPDLPAEPSRASGQDGNPWVLAAFGRWPRASHCPGFVSISSIREAGGRELEMPLHNPPQGTSWWVHLGTGAAGGQAQSWWGTKDPQPGGPEDSPLAHGALSLCREDERGCENEHVGVSPRVLVGNGEHGSGSRPQTGTPLRPQGNGENSAPRMLATRCHQALTR